MQKDVGFDFCNTVSDKKPMATEPLRVADCALDEKVSIRGRTSRGKNSGWLQNFACPGLAADLHSQSAVANQ